ncbi:MAG: phosphatidylinositol-specific phospholipase C domain-containing protein [Bacteroidales bacterium]|nr:phosphatidylinositol-specific phospholipase C domain-containing protein [Bacteroidales bacterium]
MKANRISLIIFFIAIMGFMFSGCEKEEIREEDEDVILGDQQLPYTWTNWMGKIDDKASLNQITIPGTHDSGADKHTSGLGFITAPFVICQDYSIPNQLKLGIRWLDIRLCYDGDLTVQHGSFSLRKNFKDVLHYCVCFLNDHPTETIILMIKQEHSDISDKEFSEMVYGQIEQRGLNNFFIEDRVPELGEVRGKIYVVRRFHKYFSHPLGVYASWPDNTKGSYHEYNGIGWYVQDHYSLNTVSTQAKFQEIRDCMIHAHKETSNNVYHLNYVSGERVSSGETLWETASELNPLGDHEIKAFLSNIHNCGVIFVNFAGGGDVGSGPRNCIPNFVKHIIERNGVNF